MFCVYLTSFLDTIAHSIDVTKNVTASAVNRGAGMVASTKGILIECLVKTFYKAL